MQIEIGEYVITSDTYNLILNEKKVAKEGKSVGEERLQSIGFYSKISTLISALIQREVLLSDVQSLQAMQQLIERVSLQCEKAFKDFNNATHHQG